LLAHFTVKVKAQSVKVPRPGNSERIFAVFESSCHLLLPV